MTEVVGEPEIDEEHVPAVAAPEKDPLLPIVFTLVLILAGIALAWIAFFANETRSADVDPQFIRLMGERMSRFGGTYYQNALHNKGPFDALLYHLPREVLGFDAYWYGISFFILIGTGLLAYAAGRTTLVHAVPRSAAVAIGFIAFFHFALTGADYAGVMYTRNETAYMFAVVWIIVLAPRCWTPKWSLASMAAIGALFGLASQTLVSSVVECAVLTGLVVWVMWHRVEPDRRRRHLLVGAGTAVLTFVAAPIWYVLRGSFDEFWAGWWTYASFQTTATALTTVDKFQRGWDAMTQYYGNFPLSLMIVVAFVGLTWLFWRQLTAFQRVVHVTAFAWLLAGWLELVLSWRYSSHYFAVVAVPTMFIAALLAGHALTLVARIRPLRLAPLFPVIALVGCFLYFHDNRVSAGIDSIRDYHSPAELTALRDANSPANVRTVRAILDTVSADDDALLAWTRSPTTYLQFRRVPASRFFWYPFFTGDIYLGLKGPEWVLPQTWDWFADDMAQTNPAAEWEAKVAPHDDDLPFGEYVADHMTKLYDGSLDNLFIRNDIAAALASPDGLTELPVTTGAPLADGDTLDLVEGSCQAVAMTIRGDTDAAMATFHLGGTDFADRILAVADTGVSGKDGGEVLDTATLPDAVDGTRQVVVVLGDHTAILMVDGVIAGAVATLGDVPTLAMVADQDGLVVDDVRAGPVTWPTGALTRPRA